MAYSRRKENKEKLKEGISGGSHPKYVPIDDIPPEQVFDFVYLTDESTIKYLNDHSRIAFVLRGPPGTRKELLRDLILSAYKNSIACCADDYFSLSHGIERNRLTLRHSHDWCEERLEEYCHQNKPSIIVKNSHIRKWEVEPYLKILRRNGYTILVCETTRKFKVNTKILEKSNTKGLKENYFKQRLKQWDEVVPWFTGWFLNPADGDWIFNKAEEIFTMFSNNEDFQEICSDTGNVNRKFCQEASIFCIAAYCNAGQTEKGKSFYLNEEIQDIYGKMFELNVTTFVLYKNMLIAVVRLTPEEQKISFYERNADSFPNGKDRSDPLERALEKMTIDNCGNLNTQVKVDKKNSKETFEVLDKSDGKNDEDKYGFMLLGRKGEGDSSPLISELRDCRDLQNVMVTLSEEKAEKTITVNGVNAHKIENAIVVELNQCFRCKSVFTGLY